MVRSSKICFPRTFLLLQNVQAMCARRRPSCPDGASLVVILHLHSNRALKKLNGETRSLPLTCSPQVAFVSLCQVIETTEGSLNRLGFPQLWELSYSSLSPEEKPSRDQVEKLAMIGHRDHRSHVQKEWSTGRLSQVGIIANGHSDYLSVGPGAHKDHYAYKAR